MNKVFFPILFFVLGFWACENREPQTGNKIPFDFEWKFALNEQQGAEQSGFDDSDWRLLDVPHDFSIEHPFDSTHSTNGGGGFAYSGIGWYRKSFETKPDFQDKQIRILFDGVYRNSAVWI